MVASKRCVGPGCVWRISFAIQSCTSATIAPSCGPSDKIAAAKGALSAAPSQLNAGPEAVRSHMSQNQEQRPQRAVWAYAAAAWASIFAVFHIIWAAGWYPLLDLEGARAAFAVPWKWTFDAVVAVMCVVAVPVMLAPVTSWGHHLPPRLVRSLTYIGTLLLVLRSMASLVQTGYLMAIGSFRFAMLGIWEWWFHLGAVLFVASTFNCIRAEREQRSA